MTIGLDGLEKLNWGYVVITTPNGILDHEEAMRQNVGGQVLGFFHKELVFLVCVNGHQEATLLLPYMQQSLSCPSLQQLFFFHICSSLYPVHHYSSLFSFPLPFLQRAYTQWGSSTSGLIYDRGSPRGRRRREHISIRKESNAYCISNPATMGVSCNYASSILLCTEDNSSILVFDEDEELGINRKAQWSGLGKICEQKTSFFRDSFFLCSSHSEECLFALLKKESEHTPAKEYAQRLMRGSLDISVHAYYSFGPLSAYLSINYLDRFLSAYELSIGNAKYVFEAKTIQRMELLVLSTLEWRMHFVTPFSFMDYFVHKFSNGSPPKQSEINHCIELILNTCRENCLIEFKPSEVAATAVALAVLGNANKLLIDNVLNHCAYMEKDKVMKCYEVIQDMRLVEMRSSLVSKAPQTPVGVLDVTCLSYTSAETTACLGSNSQSCAAVKRRRKERMVDLIEAEAQPKNSTDHRAHARWLGHDSHPPCSVEWSWVPFGNA
ncbi:hypothetical protein HPP92_028096 [Vanilla planifolia]|uniref:Cyclin C-terminal domain-containing protein n=1 Tax=Vanilla planifolia TaxID=51239 RepID=A0A835PA05_VANPL|nr:hypothetical protein HPP92_028096 [Vanilla planifolia]